MKATKAKLVKTKREPVKRPRLLPCPFCGGPATISSWHGGGRQKRAVFCENDDCGAQPMVTGGTPELAALQWNTRYESPEVLT